MSKLSVIIPVYNNENDLERCFNSILNQNINDLEIIVVNDGSTDNSDKIIQEYEKNHQEIKYFKKENTGVADSRNYGIEKASGKYIMFLDADDYLDIALYKNIKKYIDEDIDLIKYKIQIVDKDENTIELVQGATFEKTNGEEGFSELYSTDVLLDSPCAYIIKKEIFEKNDLKFKVGTEHEDFGLIPFVIIFAKTMVSINFYGYYYVQTDNSITRNNDYKKSVKKAYDALIHYDDAMEKIENLNVNKKTKDNLKIYYTNAILTKVKSLSEKDKIKYMEELKKRKFYKNIKIRNVKQLIKKILLFSNIDNYLKLK